VRRRGNGFLAGSLASSSHATGADDRPTASNVPVPPALLGGLRELGTAMRIDESYWTRLKTTDCRKG
jgi:hypothetical protein